MANFNPSMGSVQPVGNSQAGMNYSFPYGNQPQNSNLYNYFNNGLNNSMNLQNNQCQFLKCRPVSSKEEARATQIDFDGSLWVFTDVGNEKIYTKQIMNDGTATFKTYAFVKDENPYSSTEFVTKDEFNKVIQSLIAAIPNLQQEIPSQTKEQKSQLNF